MTVIGEPIGESAVVTSLVGCKIIIIAVLKNLINDKIGLSESAFVDMALIREQ